ncbi:MAG: hypothetical protein JWN76_2761 [Chitinophagaceae bacterium]|nr:hypothetical protein [Chitinophagaceae bacterium]
MQQDNSQSIQSIITEAGKAEGNGDLENAAGMYEQLIKQDNLNEYAYERLMIVYRKLKSYKEELRVINAGIKSFQNFYQSKLKSKSKKITELSKALSKSTGLTDKKGNSLYEPEPIGKWKKRKLVVEKKIK